VDQAEELDEHEWDAAGGRLRAGHMPFQQLLGVCNPEDPSHFLFSRFRPDLGTRRHYATEDITLRNGMVIPKGTLLIHTILSDPTANYRNLPPAYIMRLQRTKGRFYERYVLGRWVAFEGVVYDLWDPRIHCVDRPLEWAAWGGYPPPDWPRVRAFDFGYANPFVCQWWAIAPEGAWYRYREIYHTRRTIPVHKAQIVQLEETELETLRQAARTMAGGQLAAQRRWGYYLDDLHVLMSVADHGAQERALLDERPFPIGTAPADKDIEPGIQDVYQMMVPMPEADGVERPQLRFIHKHLALVEEDEWLKHNQLPCCTEEEMSSYRRPKAPERGSDKPQKEEPINVNNHGCDATRYAVRTVRPSLGLTVELL
jgi:hypothetical protein